LSAVCCALISPALSALGLLDVFNVFKKIRLQFSTETEHEELLPSIQAAFSADLSKGSFFFLLQVILRE
jgi:hypothetical protein